MTDKLRTNEWPCIVERNMSPERCVSKWIEMHERYVGQHVTAADADHSPLLHRLLHGIDPLPYPPPRAMSYPWYTFCTTDEPLYGIEAHFHDGDNKTVIVEQALWNVVDHTDDGRFVIEWPEHYPWRAWLWEDPNPKNGPLFRWVIQRIAVAG